MDLLSGSELDTFAKCRMLHTYSYGLHLEPRVKSRALQVGSAGHAVLAEYYRAIQSGASHQAAVAQAEALTSWTWLTADVDAEHGQFALGLVRAYWATGGLDASHGEVIGVEEQHRINYPSYTFAFTLDLALLNRDTNTVTIVDHRFLGQFYDPEVAVLDPQLPRYSWSFVDAGYNVRAVRNMILTGKTAMRPSKRVLQVEVPLTTGRMTTVARERDRLAAELIAWRQHPLEWRLSWSPRTFNSMVCSRCPFKVPCSLRAEGLDDQLVLDEHFQPSSYGYEDD